MKKLIAIAVLLVLLTTAVFAQDEGWKFGLMAQHFSDLVWATSMSGKSEASAGGTTVTEEFGGFNKGSFNFFNGKYVPTPDNRLLFKVSHTGESHEVYVDIALDDWVKAFANDGTLLEFLSKKPADWYAKGNVGIFNGQVGTAGYGGFVSTQATWNDYLGWNQLCRFGVWNTSGFLASDDFRTWPEWGPIVALGAGFGDFKFSIGHRLNPGWWDSVPSYNDPTDSASSINASFMFSGRPIDLLTFDLFYAINGYDPDTYSRSASPNGKWQNLVGAYVGLNVVDNLGLSLGYTANFDAYDKGAYIDGTDTPDKSKPVTYTAPIFSGVDIRVSYSGIDKIGLTFNNNVSFAGVKGKKFEKDDERILGFSGSPLGEDLSQDWFHWNAELKATFALVDNMGLTLHLGNQLGVTTDESTASGASGKYTATDNEFRVALTADYGIGTVSVGTGMFFSVKSKVVNAESSGYTYDGNTDIVSFGMPILFKVAF
jgi:hypothetical protein